MSLSDDIQQLAAADLLSERQAEAYILREIEAVPRQAAADEMGISVNTLDNTISAANSKIESAARTLDVIDELEHEEIPTSCANCGDGLGGRYVEEDGDAFCVGCSSIDPSNL
jgi:hypothetical protein